MKVKAQEHSFSRDNDYVCSQDLTKEDVLKQQIPRVFPANASSKDVRSENVNYLHTPHNHSRSPLNWKQNAERIQRSPPDRGTQPLSSPRSWNPPGPAAQVPGTLGSVSRVTKSANMSKSSPKGGSRYNQLIANVPETSCAVGREKSSTFHLSVQEQTRRDRWVRPRSITHAVRWVKGAEERGFRNS